MIELEPEITKELNDIVSSLESAKESLRPKFNNLFEEFIAEAFENFYSTIENSTSYNFNYWVRSTCDKIVQGLIAGDMKYIEHARLVSDFDWTELRKMRLAIWEEAGGELANATIAALLKENAELKEQIQRERDYRHRSF